MSMLSPGGIDRNRVEDNRLYLFQFPFHFYFIFSLFSILVDLGLGFSMTSQSHDTVTVMWSQWKDVKGSSMIMTYNMCNICWS